MAKILDRYIFRELVPPFLVGLLLVTFVLLMNQVLLLAQLFIERGVPALEALRLLALLLPSILVFALPMAVLMGILGGLARLAADSEVVAFQSLGVGPSRIVRPVVFFGLCGFVLTLPLALVIAPRANHAWVRAVTDSVLARVRLEVNPMEFNESLPNMVFLVRDVDREGAWRDVFAYLTKDPGQPRLVMARSGRMALFPEKRRAVLELSDGVLYAGTTADPETDSLTSFERLEEEIDVQGLFAAASDEKRVREKDIAELVRDRKALMSLPPGARDARAIRAHGLEIHKKFALPFACLVFALLGLPLGIKSGRVGRTGGFSLGLAVILVYYALLTAGEKMAMDGSVSAFLGMWAPDIVLTALGLVLFLRSAGRSPTPSWRRAPVGPGAGEARRPAGVPPRPSGPRRRLPAVRFPGLLDRYVGRKFLSILTLAFLALTGATALVMFFERLDEVLRRGKPVGLLLRAVWFKLPEYLAFILPVAVLAATLLALGSLTRTNEVTAMKASGISVARAILPVLVLAAGVSGLGFLVQERVVPAAHARSEEAESRLLDRPSRSYSYLNRHWILGRGQDRIYHYDYFDAGSATFGRLSVFDVDPRRWTLVRRFFAARAAFEDGSLVYEDGWTRDFGPPAGPAFARRQSGRLAADDDKSAFLTGWKEPLQMTLGELRRTAAEVRAMGFRATRLRAAVGEKTALPFVGMVMALLAVPFGFSVGKKGTLVGVGVSVAIAMVYWGAFAIFRSLGAAGVLSPFLGAWGANLIFGLAGISLLLRLRA